MMENILQQICELYKTLEEKNCLCFTADSNDGSKREECQLLLVRFVGLLSEVYFDCAKTNQKVCSNVLLLFETFSSKNVLNKFVHLLKFNKNKFLIWTTIKSFSSVFYASDGPVLDFVHVLLTDVKDRIFLDESIFIIDFLSGIVEYKELSENVCDINSICKAVTYCSLPSIADSRQNFCIMLSNYWNGFLEQFYQVCGSSCHYQSMVSFLVLWQKLAHKHFEEDQMFLNDKCVVSFFSTAPKLNVLCLRIYVDIIMQFFVLKDKVSSSKADNISFPETICDILNDNFLKKLPCDMQLSNFCVVHKLSNRQRIDETSQKCDPIIAKKVSYICLNSVIGTKNVLLLCSALQKVFTFMKDNFNVLPQTPIHSYLLGIYIDEDDLLIGMMLILLKLYNVFQKISGQTTDLTECNKMKSYLNAHLIFISFLKQLGFDHNELLSFLTSDETCFLSYLMQYTKNLLKENDLFIEAHNFLVKNTCDAPTRVISESSENFSDDFNLPVKKRRVDFSSSSSNEESPFSSSETDKCCINEFSNYSEKSSNNLNFVTMAPKQIIDSSPCLYEESKFLSSETRKYSANEFIDGFENLSDYNFVPATQKQLVDNSSLSLHKESTFMSSETNKYRTSECSSSLETLSGDLIVIPSAKKQLVDYSSSSSHEESTVLSSTHQCNTKFCLKDFVVLKTLFKLKESIQKLVNLKQFPYNVSPLLSVLSACEELS